MPRYTYEGRDSTGKKKTGVLEGHSETGVAGHLIQTGITPLSILLVNETPKGRSLSDQLGLGRPSIQDLSFFCRQMHALIRSGVSIVRALRVVNQSVKNEYLNRALTHIISTVEDGRTLGSAMKDHTDIFPSLLISLINVGENTGSLEMVFEQASTHFERELETKKRIKTATRYPIMVILVIVVAIGVVNMVVIPAFASFFEQFKAQLPLPTRILVAVSNFTVAYWHWILAGIVIVVFACLKYVRSPKGQYQWDALKLKIPLIGSIIKRSLLARFARSFSLCIRTGVPLLDSIHLMAKATDNVYVAEKISNMRIDIEHGESLTSAALQSKMFTPLVLQMLLIGEESGEIDRLISEVASYYEQELDYDVKRLGDYIEPILLSVLGALVLVLALGIYLPMWDISKAALGK